MKPIAIGVDVDGVLASFVPAYCALTASLTGRVLPAVPSCWEWARVAGMTKEEEGVVWGHIHANPGAFWGTLGAEDGARQALDTLDLLSARGTAEVYFITHRPRGAKAPTEDWLAAHGVSVPTVILASQKGKVAQALDLDVFIDDRTENALEVYRALPQGRAVYLLAKSWNQDAREAWVRAGSPGGVRVVDTLTEWLAVDWSTTGVEV